MSKFSKILALLAIVASVVLVGFLAGWWGPSRSSTYNQQVAIEPTSSFLATNSIPTPGPAATKTSVRKQRPAHQAGSPAIGSSLSAGTATNLIPDWEDKVDAILTSEGEDSAKAKQMLEMFPRLSAEAQEEVVHHISNLTPDEDYAGLGNLLKNSALSEDVLDVLLEDVLNRPNAVKLPMLLEVARDPQHPKAAEAKDVLELFLEEDYGGDWSKWQAKMDVWLKDNPD